MSAEPIVGRLSYVGIAVQTVDGVPATQPTHTIPFKDIPDFLAFEYTEINSGLGIREAMRDKILTRIMANATTSLDLSMDTFPLFARGGFGNVTSALDTGIRSAVVNVAGTGYTSRPTLTFSGTGTGARAEAYMRVLAGTVVAGSGYTNGVYPITFTGGQVPILPDGTAPQPATGTLTVAGGVFTTVTITSGGTGYIERPIASATVPGGTGGSIAITLAGSQVFILDRGQGYTGTPTITPTGGAGTGLTFTVTASTSTTSRVNSYTVRQSSNLPRLTYFVDYGPLGKYRISDVIVSKMDLDLVNEGTSTISVDLMGTNVLAYNFTTASATDPTYFIKPQIACVLSPSVAGLTTVNTTCSITSTTGSGFLGIPVISKGAIIDVQIISKGAGYAGGDTISFTGAGAGATATLTIVNGSITNVTMTNTGTTKTYGNNPYIAFAEALTFSLDNSAENIYTAGNQSLSPSFIVAKSVMGSGTVSITMRDSVLRAWNLDNQTVALRIRADNGVPVDTALGSQNFGFTMILNKVQLDSKQDGGVDDIRKVSADFTMLYDSTNARSVALETYSTFNITA